MKGVHKKDGGEKSRQTWRKTVREKERKEEGGKRNAWKMDRKTEKRGKADLEKEREKERWRRKGKHREKKRPGEKKTVGWKKKDGWRKGTETREKDRAAV